MSDVAVAPPLAVPFAWQGSWLWDAPAWRTSRLVGGLKKRRDWLSEPRSTSGPELTSALGRVSGLTPSCGHSGHPYRGWSGLASCARRSWVRSSEPTCVLSFGASWRPSPGRAPCAWPPWQRPGAWMPRPWRAPTTWRARICGPGWLPMSACAGRSRGGARRVVSNGSAWFEAGVSVFLQPLTLIPSARLTLTP